MVSRTARQYLEMEVDTGPLPSFRYVLPLCRGRKVLDIGCGAGQYLRHFSRGSLGIDVSRRNRELCRARGLAVREADLNAGLPVGDGEFEVVFASHVLEHVDSPINLLRECHRVLKAHGVLVVGVPTEFSIVRLLRDDYWGDHPEHLHAFSVKNLEHLFGLCGFRVERVFIDLRKVEKWRLGWLLDLVQRVPARLTMWMSNGYWMVGGRVDGED